MPSAFVRRASRWLAIIVLIVSSIIILWGGFGWESYSQVWLGKMFRATSGAAIGWLVSHFIIGLDLSEIPEGPERIEAAKSQAMIIGAFALAVAFN